MLFQRFESLESCVLFCVQSSPTRVVSPLLPTNFGSSQSFSKAGPMNNLLTTISCRHPSQMFIDIGLFSVRVQSSTALDNKDPFLQACFTFSSDFGDTPKCSDISIGSCLIRVNFAFRSSMDPRIYLQIWRLCIMHCFVCMCSYSNKLR